MVSNKVGPCPPLPARAIFLENIPESFARKVGLVRVTLCRQRRVRFQLSEGGRQMAAASPVSEAELEEVLRTDPNFAVQMLDADYCEQILEFIKRETWGRLQPAELMDTYQETMRAFIRKMRQPNFDP